MEYGMTQAFFDSLIKEEDYICGNRFIEISNCDSILFSKVDNISEFSQKKVDVFITHNGDYDVNPLRFDSGPVCKVWYAQNKNVNNNKVISIPIGLENFEPEFSYKSQFGRFSSLPKDGPRKKDFIFDLSSANNDKTNLVYLNFNTTTYPTERNYVKNLFNDKKWITKEQNVSWKEYYISLSNSKFCLSPRGNGIDTHRIWEALYLRTIPIVKRSYYMEEFSDLPILFIDDWRELSEEFLEEKYQQIKKTAYNAEKIKMSYWKQEINKKLNIILKR